jgi:hypothetical protein
MRVVECIAAGAVCGFGLLNSAGANPPLSREKSWFPAIDSARSVSTAGLRQESTSTTHLDLRPPMNYPPTITPGDVRELPSTPSLSPIRHSDLDENERVLPPALGIDEANFRSMSKAKIFVSRVHREGLPFARLWESKSALLSIGLNPKGKPGLWLIQKIR